MSDVTIGGIATTASSLAGADLIEIEQGGSSKKAALSLLLGMLLDNDTSLAGDSTTKAATQHAVKAAIAAAVIGANAPEILTNTDIAGGVLTPTGTTDLIRITSLAAALQIANPSTTPADGDGFVAYYEDDGTSRAITWDTKYASSEFATLIAATTAGKRHRLGFEYHAGDDKLYCMYAEVEA